MRNSTISVDEAKDLILSGHKLLLAGDETVLRKLPKGDWIGGTIPYFIASPQGGMISRTLVFATDITGIVENFEVVQYDHIRLSKVFTDGLNHSFSFILIPARSITHLSFAVNAPGYKDFGVRPLVGWISGVHLDTLGEITPKVFNGKNGTSFSEGALVLHADLIQGKKAQTGIINLFEQGDGDEFVFPVDGFSAHDVLVNGQKENFASYIKRNNLDTKLPLVADYKSLRANTSFQAIDDILEEVTFYAPVFKGVVYKHAKPIPDYVEAFDRIVSEKKLASQHDIVFSCNCILNYLYSELEGKKTGSFVGPITFGEIANRLLNQTLVFLEISES
jgi:hypothetical protein